MRGWPSPSNADLNADLLLLRLSPGRTRKHERERSSLSTDNGLASVFITCAIAPALAPVDAVGPRELGVVSSDRTVSRLDVVLDLSQSRATTPYGHKQRIRGEWVVCSE